MSITGFNATLTIMQPPATDTEAGIRRFIAADPHDVRRRNPLADYLDETGRHEEARDERLAVLQWEVCRNPDDDAARLEWARIAESVTADEGELEAVRLGLKGLPHYHLSCTGGKCPGCSCLRSREAALSRTLSLCRRSEFCRVQVELAKLGNRRLFPINHNNFAFWKADVSTVFVQNASELPVIVGERVDVQLEGLPPRSTRRRVFVGLLVTDCKRGRLAGGVVESSVELRMDELSQPWQGDVLRKREEELLEGESYYANPGFWHSWLPETIRPSHGVTIRQDFNRAGSATVTVLNGDGPWLSATFARGFIDSITCDWQTWLSRGQRIAWRPGWEMECGRCKGTRYVSYEEPVYGGTTTQTCHACDKGRVPRPFTGGEMPVRTLVMTSEPPDDENVTGRWRVNRDMTGYEFDRWPGLHVEIRVR